MLTILYNLFSNIFEINCFFFYFKIYSRLENLCVRFYGIMFKMINTPTELFVYICIKYKFAFFAGWTSNPNQLLNS